LTSSRDDYVKPAGMEPPATVLDEGKRQSSRVRKAPLKFWDFEVAETTQLECGDVSIVRKYKPVDSDFVILEESVVRRGGATASGSESSGEDQPTSASSLDKQKSNSKFKKPLLPSKSTKASKNAIVLNEIEKRRPSMGETFSITREETNTQLQSKPAAELSSRLQTADNSAKTSASVQRVARRRASSVFQQRNSKSMRSVRSLSEASRRSFKTKRRVGRPSKRKVSETVSSQECFNVPKSSSSLKNTSPKTTARETSVRGATSPKTTARETAAPKTAAPKSAGPKSAAPKTAAPKTAAPKSAGPKSASPKSSAHEGIAAKTAASDSGPLRESSQDADSTRSSIDEPHPDCPELPRYSTAGLQFGQFSGELGAVAFVARGPSSAALCTRYIRLVEGFLFLVPPTEIVIQHTAGRGLMATAEPEEAGSYTKVEFYEGTLARVPRGSDVLLAAYGDCFEMWLTFSRDHSCSVDLRGDLCPLLGDL